MDINLIKRIYSHIFIGTADSFHAEVTLRNVILVKLFSEARHLKSVEALLDDEDINKTKEISKDAARTE